MPRLRILLLVTLSLAGSPTVCPAQPTPARSAGAAYTSAAALQDRGLYDLAAKEWLAMLKAHPDDPLASRARYNLGVCRFQQGDFSAAAEQFQAAATGKHAESVAAAAWANLGLARFNLASSLPAEQQPAANDAYGQAIAAFDRLLRDFPKSSQVATSHFYRGESLSALSKPAEAAKSFEAVLADQNAASLHEASRLGLARAELDSGQPASAVATLNSLIAANPAGGTKSEAHLLRGEAHLAAGDPRAAAADFAEAATDSDPADMDSVLERHAFALYTAQDYSKASDVYARLANRHPNSPLAADARVASAKCLMLSGLDRQAERAFDKLWNAAPTAGNAEAAHWLVQTLLKRNKHADAARVARQALATSPAPQWRAPLQLALADSLSEEPGGQREALQLFTNYAREHAGTPEGERAAYLAAYTALELEDHNTAYQLANRFVQQHRQHELRADAQLVAAEAADKLGKREEAMEFYTNLLNASGSDPRSAQWRLRLSAMHREAGQWDAAARVLEGPTDSLPPDARQDALLQLAESQRAAGDRQACLNTLARLMALRPTGDPHARALYLRGEVLTQGGKASEANADFAQLAQSAPQHELAPYALYALASNQSTAGDTKQAQQTLKNLLANYREGPLGQARFLYANVLYQEKQYDAALAELAQAEAPEPDKAFLVGMLRAAKQEDDLAVSLFDSLVRQHPRHKLAPQALHESAWLMRESNPKAAIERFGRVVSQYPDSPLAPEAALRAGELLYEANQPQDAIAWLAKAAQAPAASPEVKAQALHLTGWAQFDRQRYKQALAAFDQQLSARRDGPLSTDAMRMRGECYFELEQFEDALRAYNEPAAAQRDAGLASLESLAALHAGQAAAQVGKWQESLTWLDRAMKTEDANREQVQYERAWALANLKRTNEAKQLFEQLADASNSPLAARSRFMLGEMQFAHKQYEAAVRTFFRVAYGYGGRDAPQEYHAWQSESLFEAARCLEELDRKEPAKKLYLELLERFPESPKARHARTRLQSGVLR